MRLVAAAAAAVDGIVAAAVVAAVDSIAAAVVVERSAIVAVVVEVAAVADSIVAVDSTIAAAAVVGTTVAVADRHLPADDVALPLWLPLHDDAVHLAAVAAAKQPVVAAIVAAVADELLPPVVCVVRPPAAPQFDVAVPALLLGAVAPLRGGVPLLAAVAAAVVEFALGGVSLLPLCAPVLLVAVFAPLAQRDLLPLNR